MKQTIEHVDVFSLRCGFYNTNTVVNNGYGCNHPECEELELVKKTKTAIDIFDTEDCRISNADALKIFVEKRTKRNVFCNKRLAKKYMRLFEANYYNNTFLEKYGLKQQGKCYAFSCPLAYEADRNDIIDITGDDPDHYEEGEYLVVNKQESIC